MTLNLNYNPTLNNEMVQFGSQLDHLSYSEYQSEMIEKFFPDADIDMINQMIEWANQPLMKLITIKKLRSMIIDAANKRFKKQMADQIVPTNEIDQFRLQLQTIQDCTKVCIHPHQIQYAQLYDLQDHEYYAHTWSKFIMMTHLGLELPNTHICMYHEHIHFADHIHSIWTANQLARVAKSLHTISDLQTEVNQLKQKNADLSYQVQLTAYSLSILQPANPVYDYHAIKSRKQKLHQEFKRLSKLMKLG
jgi:FtsZ-binding cell division protein ZapB